MSSENLDKHIEFETKYRISGDLQFKFKEIVSQLNFKKFFYTEGPDVYYTKPDGSFLRYRNATTHKFSEVTLKQKYLDSKTNVIRKEINWRVDGTSKDSIAEGAHMMGYKYNFNIWKACHIYVMQDDTTLVFYTVRDEEGKTDHFIEIELTEDKIHTLTKEEAWDIIRKYEEKLESLGITHRKRLAKSLYEMYVKDIDYGS